MPRGSLVNHSWRDGPEGQLALNVKTDYLITIPFPLISSRYIVVLP